MEKFKDYVKDIADAYETGVTLDQAERLAAKFLCAQLEVGSLLKDADLDARMKKSGLKAVKAAVYLKTATSGDKKPSDVLIEAVINSDSVVATSQDSLDTAEVLKNELENYLHVFKEAHIYFRGVSKGRFE